MPSRVKGTGFQTHPFFEASSIRKIGSTYYFLYSSIHGHELCYATSRYPDRDFAYGGTIVSNGDVGYQGRGEKDRLNTTGTNHGSIVCINGQWYVFYHRNTNKTAYSRQACAEPIEILPDGTIPQVEITSQGLRRKPLKASGTYPAAICCNLTSGRMPHQGNGIIKKNIPYITCENGERIVVATNQTHIVYKYFDFPGRKTKLTLRYKAAGDVKIAVMVSGQNDPVGILSVSQAEDWEHISIVCDIPTGVRSLTFLWQSSSALKLLEFSIDLI